MIKPTDITESTKPNVADLAEQEAIEAHFDRAIQAAASLGEWPARTGGTRSGWRSVNIAAVVARYVEAGWKVNQSERDSVATFARPTHGR